MNDAGRGAPRAEAQSRDAARPGSAGSGSPEPATATAEAVTHGDLAVPRGCAFLLAEGGGWRLDTPARDHRCAAFSPPASLSPEKQARLCLTAAHTSCATYLASLAARQERLGGTPVDRATRWGLARTTTIIEDSGGIRGRVLTALLDRRRWPAIPAVLLVTTLFTLAISGFRAGIPATPVATSSPVAPGLSSAATSPRSSIVAPTPARSAGFTRTSAPVSPAPTEAPPSQAPGASPTAQAATPVPTQPRATFRTYRVRPGDTLSGIAGRFRVTVTALARLNNIDDPSRLSIGQVLRIP